MTGQNDILEETGLYIFHLFKDKLSPNYVYHNYQHTIETVELCEKLSETYHISEEDKEILLIAAWFHDAGYVFMYNGHEEKSKEIARDFLKQKNYEENKIAVVLECIDSTNKNNHPSNLISKIIADANISDIGRETYFEKAALLRAELSKCNIISYNSEEWEKAQLDFLQSKRFYTEEAQKMYGEQQNLNIKKLKKKIKKQKKKEEKKKDVQIKLEDPSHGIQTVFRSIYRNHINLSSIADDKANMMIRVNSMIISIALTLVGAKFSFLGTSFKENQIVIYPIIMLLFTGLATIIFAILSAKPKVTHKLHQAEDIKDNNTSILFFGNFSNLTLDDFKYSMRELFKNKDSIYDNMTTDLYYLGKVLTRKYFLIKISYMVFMVGMILTALTTVFVVIYLKETD